MVQSMFDLDGEKTQDMFLSEADSGVMLTPIQGKACFFARQRATTAQ